MNGWCPQVQLSHAPGDVLETLLAAQRSQKEVVLLLRSGNSGLSASAGSEQVEREKIVLSEVCEQIGQAYIELVEVRTIWLHQFSRLFLKLRL